MSFRTFRTVWVSVLLLSGALPTDLFAWHDRTHLAIAEAAGFDLWYSAAAPDVAKSKEQFTAIESPNHYYNNKYGQKVDAPVVLDQAERYDLAGDNEGHLYGAIIGSVRAFRSLRKSGKYARYPLVFCAHYIGDLSMPLHNTPYDEFNKARHSINDGVIDAGVRDSVASISKRIRPIEIRNEDDFAREIASLAESARKLGARMRSENRDMTHDEAYIQVIRSASLLKAVLAYSEHPPEEGRANSGNP
jgi:hypothetical protein